MFGHHIFVAIIIRFHTRKDKLQKKKNFRSFQNKCSEVANFARSKLALRLSCWQKHNSILTTYCTCKVSVYALQ